MDFEWDEEKSEWNRHERGFGFEVVLEIDWSRSTTRPSLRTGEIRLISVGRTSVGIVAVVWTIRGEKARVISVRRVHHKEARKHGFEEEA